MSKRFFCLPDFHLYYLLWMGQDKSKKTRFTTWYPWIEIVGWRTKVFSHMATSGEEWRIMNPGCEVEVTRTEKMYNTFLKWGLCFNFREVRATNLCDSQCSTVKWKDINTSTSAQNFVSSGLRLRFKRSPDTNSTRSWRVNNNSPNATQRLYNIFSTLYCPIQGRGRVWFDKTNLE